jgi:hypothetical protein
LHLKVHHRCLNDTGERFTARIVDTGGKFTAGVTEINVNPGKDMATDVVTLMVHEYLREFLKKIAMALRELSGNPREEYSCKNLHGQEKGCSCAV